MVRKFLLRYLGPNYQLSQADPYGILLAMLCVKKAKKVRGNGGTTRYSATFSVTGNVTVGRKKKFEGLSEHCTVQFNNFVELVLKTEFHTLAFTYTQGPEGTTRTIQEAVDDFMNKFGLTAEDIDPMSLRRSFLRYRRRYLDQHNALVTHRQRHGLPV